MFVVVEVTCGRRGGRWLLKWWLWDEEGSCVTVCDACDFGITNVRARAHAHVRAQICTVDTIYNFVVSII